MRNYKLQIRNDKQMTKDKGEKIEKGMSLPDIPFSISLFSERFYYSNLGDILIPLHSIRIATALIIFQGIRQCRSITTEGEIITCIRRKHHRTTHIETVEITLQTCSSHTHFMIVEIITG